MKNKIRKRTYTPIRRILLKTLIGAGVIGVAVLAPKATKLLKEFDRGAKSREKLHQRISKALSRLEKAGLVKVSGEWGKRSVVLTEKGRKLAETIEVETYRIPEPAFWDGKWRVLMFDIQEERKRVRHQLRSMLQNVGFIRLQDSVWVYPYPCDEFISLVRAHLRSGVGEVRSMVAEALESDRELRNHFKLR
jgi:phenylacetic acid degradation operon negative regulatory protein